VSDGGLVVVDHALVRHKLSLLRDKRTTTKDFRQLVSELAYLLSYEATRDLELEEVEVETPLERTTGHQVSGKKLGIVAVLRAGVGMLDAVLELIPVARVGFDLDQRDVLLLDPMLATGGSTSAAAALCKAAGARRISLLCLVASPEGVERLARDHPDVTVYTASLDRGLNEQGYILPGLGDAGDRLYGTR
jgi:uracil phosphoribosyltransferase